MGWREEFPDFPQEDMPNIPQGFEDISWHNDACPNFHSEKLRLAIFVDYADPERREFPDCPRFVLYRTGPDAVTEDLVAESESWAEMLAAIKEQEGRG